MTLTTAKWSLDDYHRMIDAGILVDRQVELLNGEIVEMSPEGTPHAAYSQNAGDYLRSVLGNRATIREAKPITLPDSSSEPEPDIAIVAPHRLEVYLQHHPYPQDIFWVIEFSYSSLTKDLESKSKIYAASGIPEYWVINLRSMTLIVFRSPQNGEYTSETTIDRGVIQPIAFTDISISVDRLLGK